MHRHAVPMLCIKKTDDNHALVSNPCASAVFGSKDKGVWEKDFVPFVTYSLNNNSLSCHIVLAKCVIVVRLYHLPSNANALFS